MFKNALDIEQMCKYVDSNKFTMPNYLLDFLNGKSLLLGKKGDNCTRVFIPMLANVHYFATELLRVKELHPT